MGTCNGPLHDTKIQYGQFIAIINQYIAWLDVTVNVSMTMDGNFAQTNAELSGSERAGLNVLDFLVFPENRCR